jgi:hypothetical protein
VALAEAIGVGVADGPEAVVTLPMPSPHPAIIMAKATLAPKKVLVTMGKPLRKVIY